MRAHTCAPTHMRTHTPPPSRNEMWSRELSGEWWGGGLRGRECVFPLLYLPLRAHQPCHPRPGGTSRDLGVWRWICPSRSGGGASIILTGPRPEHTMGIRLTNPRAPSTASRDPQASILLVHWSQANHSFKRVLLRVKMETFAFSNLNEAVNCNERPRGSGLKVF